MSRLDLDYVPRNRALSWPGALLLALAVAAAVLISGVYSDSQREAERLEAQVERLRRASGDVGAGPRLDEQTVLEVRNANRIIGQMTFSWERLFEAVESASSARVALLGMVPDQKTGGIEISGEAADREALFDYLERLRRQEALRNVYLLNHQTNTKDPERPLRFTVTASWTEAESN